MSLLEHNKNLDVILTDEEATELEGLIRRGLSEEQALSLTGYSRMAWVNHVAVMTGEDSEWLKRLTARGAQYVAAKAIDNVIRYLESDSCDARFALDVLSRRDAAWSTKATLQVEQKPLVELPMRDVVATVSPSDEGSLEAV